MLEKIFIDIISLRLDSIKPGDWRKWRNVYTVQIVHELVMVENECEFKEIHYTIPFIFVYAGIKFIKFFLKKF